MLLPGGQRETPGLRDMGVVFCIARIGKGLRLWWSRRRLPTRAARGGTLGRKVSVSLVGRRPPVNAAPNLAVANVVP